MEVLFFLIPLSLLLVLLALWAFVWSVNNNQFEDLDREAWRILFEDADKDGVNGSRKDEL